MKQITKERFNLLALARLPEAKLIGQELEWLSNTDETLIGTIYLDLIDLDFGFILLGRDEYGVFRSINGGAAYVSHGDAREAFELCLRAELKKNQETLSKGKSARNRRSELFAQIVSTEKLNPSFKLVANNIAYSPAKEVIAELGYLHGNPDKNFTEQFQTRAFDARLWELYLHIFLHEEGFHVNTAQSSPDFICQKGDKFIAIEAVTVNPSETIVEPKDPETEEEVHALNKGYVPIKFGSALYSKLQKKYWEKEPTRGKPFVIAVHDFHKSGSMLWTHNGLVSYLFGYRHLHTIDDQKNLIIKPEKIVSHTWGEKTIPSGFFDQPDTENVAAIISTTSATISKFLRMGKLAQFGDKRTRVFRQGLMLDHNVNADKPIPFRIEISDESYFESWSESVSVFHNPNALMPLEPKLFPNAAHHFLEKDGNIRSFMPDIFVFTSITITSKS